MIESSIKHRVLLGLNLFEDHLNYNDELNFGEWTSNGFQKRITVKILIERLNGSLKYRRLNCDQKDTYNLGLYT